MYNNIQLITAKLKYATKVEHLQFEPTDQLNIYKWLWSSTQILWQNHFISFSN